MFTHRKGQLMVATRDGSGAFNGCQTAETRSRVIVGILESGLTSICHVARFSMTTFAGTRRTL